VFILNALGYFAGGWVEGQVAAMLGFAVTKQERTRAAMLLWGVCYGLGLGAGLGLAFYNCQSRACALLVANVIRSSSHRGRRLNKRISAIWSARGAATRR
jgi:hypothetical protein